MPNQILSLLDNKDLTGIINIYKRGNQWIEELNPLYPFSIIHHKKEPEVNEVHFSLTVPGFHISDTIAMEDYVSITQHQHNIFECMIVLSGTITHHLENHSFRYTAGQCCILNRNILHTEKFSDSFDVFYLGLQYNFLKHLLSKSENTIFLTEKNLFFINSLLDIPTVHDHKPAKIYIDYVPNDPQEASSYIGQFIMNIQKETISPKFGSDYFVMSYFCSLISTLENPSYFCTTKIQVEFSQQELLFAKIKTIVEAHHGCISRKELENLMHYNGEYINRIVNQFTGNNLSYLCQSQSLSFFITRLLNTSDRIELILESMKVSNHTHFYKLFQKRFGMTPNNYRLKYSKLL